MNSKKNPAIAIVGAGPAGLLTAHYLQKRGYRHVVVFEKLGRVGGLCETINADGHAFDLGANYVTPAYREILRLAAELDLPMYSEKPFIAMSPPEQSDGRVSYQSIFNASRQREDGSLIPVFQFGWALLRYCWIRFGLRKIIDKPSFAGVAKFEDGSLAQPLESWLKTHRLTDLKRVFQLPITLMGFGELDETPAIYALKFMTLRSFAPMVLKEAPLIGRLVPWPRRFLYGYQRFFERLAWDLDVRTSIDIQRIERDGQGATIHYTELQQDMEQSARGEAEFRADYLILACPLNSDLVLKRMQASDQEREQFEPIRSVSYCMTTRAVHMDSRNLGGASPLAAVYPVPRLGSHVPYGVAKQWPNSSFAQFYTRSLSVDPEQMKAVERDVVQGAETLLRQMGGTLDQSHAASNTFNRYDYFRHVPSAVIAGGWYERLEQLQGQQRTYYVGGATNFELIEPIAEYARHLVSQHFPERSGARPGLCARLRNWFAHLGPRARRRLNWAGAALVLLAVIYWTGMPLKSVPIERPIARSSAQASAATQRFWQVLHADDAEQIPALLADLNAAYAIQAKDPVLTAILGGTHLWRFQLRQRLGLDLSEQRQDLELAVRFGQEAIALDHKPHSTAPSLTAVAQWQLAVLRGNEAALPDVHIQTLENSLLYPQFASFVQGWMLAAMLRPDHPDYKQATEGYRFMIDQCAGFAVPPETRFNKLIHTLYGLKSLFAPDCYNNPLAPHSIEGTFWGIGDAYLKQGNTARARLWYENAQTSPTYPSWRYRDVIEQRLAQVDTLGAKFVADSGKLEVSEPAMAFQSEISCGVCHTH